MAQTLRQSKERRITTIPDSVLGKPVTLTQRKGWFSRTITGELEAGRHTISAYGRKQLLREPVFDVIITTDKSGKKPVRVLGPCDIRVSDPVDMVPGVVDVADELSGKQAIVNVVEDSFGSRTIVVVGTFGAVKEELIDIQLTEAIALLNHIAVHLNT